MLQAFRCFLQPAAGISLGARGADEDDLAVVAALRGFITAACGEVQSHDIYLRKVCGAKKGQLKGPNTIRTFQALLGGMVSSFHQNCTAMLSLCGADHPACRW